MHQLLGDCLGLISTKDWRQVRNVFDPPFHYSTSQSYVDLVDSEVQRHLDALQSGTSGSLCSRGVIDPVADFKMLPFFIVVRIIYGDLPESMKDELRRLAPIREKLFHHVVAGGLTRFHWARHLPTAANRDLAAFQTAWEVFNRAAYQHAKHASTKVHASSQPPPPPIVSMWESAACGTITKPQLLQTLDEVLFANLDVTMGSISWNIVFLAANPSAQEELLAEISAATTASPLSTSSPTGSDSPSKEQERPKNPHAHLLLSSTSFLSACILESARLRPLASFTVPQSAPTTRVIDGYAIPAGTNFIVDADAINRRNPFWGTSSEEKGGDAATYRPGRFLEGRADSAGARTRRETRKESGRAGDALPVLALRLRTAAVSGEVRGGLDCEGADGGAGGEV